jgi:hypothetical protein
VPWDSLIRIDPKILPSEIEDASPTTFTRTPSSRCTTYPPGNRVLSTCFNLRRASCMRARAREPEKVHRTRQDTRTQSGSGRFAPVCGGQRNHDEKIGGLVPLEMWVARFFSSKPHSCNVDIRLYQGDNDKTSMIPIP